MLAGSEAQKKKWLPKIAAGEAIGTLARRRGPAAAQAAQHHARPSAAAG